MEKAEVVIIGGGIIGASVAYNLARMGCSDVILLEKETFPGTGSTAACAGGVRQQFSTPINVKLGIASVRLFQEYTRGLGWEIQFKQVGYLFLLTTAKSWSLFQENLHLWHSLGLRDAVVLTPEEVKKLIPPLNVEDVLGATFCPTDGIADTGALLQNFITEARSRGVRIDCGRAVTGVELTGGKVTGVNTPQGKIQTEWVVNAAGPWAGEIGRMVGVEIPVQPVRRQIVVTAPFPQIPESFPMVVDFDIALYMHRESGGMLIGMSNRDEPPGFNTLLDQEYVLQIVEKAMHRLPMLESAQIMRGWAGLYEVSPDYHSIVGEARGIRGFVCANGFSGHGFMHSPIIGQLVGEIILTGKPSMEISSLSPERFQKGSLLVEANVI